MALTKREKRFAVVAAAVVLVVGSLWAGNYLVGRIQLERQIESFDDFKWQHAQTYQQGETIRCDSAEDKALVDGEGWPYYAGFDWDGTMSITIEDSWLFGGSEEACEFVGEELGGWEGREGEDQVLFVKARVENIDAKPTFSTDTFNMSVLNGPGEWCYFNGTLDDADVKDHLEYALAPGEAKELYVGYRLSTGWEDQPLDLYLGAHRDYPEKITIQLDPKDMRGQQGA